MAAREQAASWLAALAGLTMALVLAAAPPPAAAVTLDRGDGTETQDWFRNDSFLELKDDLAEARAKGKLLVLLWEQPGCPACAKLHAVHFADPALKAYIQEHFDVLVLNRSGEVIVTDFDGQPLPEKKLAQKMRVGFTPTTVILDAEGRELFRMGYFEPFYYLGGFAFARACVTAGTNRTDAFPIWVKSNRTLIEQAYGKPPGPP